jgi:uncharacterized protein YjeT (DUF2065 family)
VISRLRLSTWAASLAAIVGGAAVAEGARLPWMSFYGGLKQMRGTIGVNGKAVFACGIVLLLAGLVLALRPDRRIRMAIGAIGTATAVYAAYLIVRMQMAVQHISSHDPMLFPKRGPGLFVVAAGALVVALTLLSEATPATADYTTGST